MALPLLMPALFPILFPLVVALLLVLGQQPLEILFEVGVALLQILGLLSDLVTLTLLHVAVTLLVRRSDRIEILAQTIASHLGGRYVIIVALGVILELVSGHLNAVAEGCWRNWTLGYIHESHPVSLPSMTMPVALAGPATTWGAIIALGLGRSCQAGAQNCAQRERPKAAYSC